MEPIVTKFGFVDFVKHPTRSLLASRERGIESIEGSHRDKLKKGKGIARFKLNEKENVGRISPTSGILLTLCRVEHLHLTHCGCESRISESGW